MAVEQVSDGYAKNKKETGDRNATYIPNEEATLTLTYVDADGAAHHSSVRLTDVHARYANHLLRAGKFRKTVENSLDVDIFRVCALCGHLKGSHTAMELRCVVKKGRKDWPAKYHRTQRFKAVPGAYIFKGR